MISGPRISAVAFDLDGLLLNTEDIFELAGAELLSRRGLVMTDQIRHGMMGRRPAEAFRILQQMTGITEPLPDLMAETKLIFAEFAENRLCVMPGAAELLRFLETRGVPCALATSSPRPYMVHLLQKFNLLHHFQVTLTAEDVQHGKPHPEIYLAAADRMSVVPSEMLVLEDSETGTRAAAAAGAFVVSVPSRHTDWGDFSLCHLRIPSLLDEQFRELLARGIPVRD